MHRRLPLLASTLAIMVAVSVSTPTMAGTFESYYHDCLEAFKAQPPATAFCAESTCGYRACIAVNSMNLHYGDIVIPGPQLTVVPAECKSLQDVMNRCIVEHLNSARPQPTPTPQDVTGQWRISQSNGYKGTLNLTQDQNGNLSGSASFNGGLSGSIKGTVTGQKITFVISYPNGLKGSYEGTVATNGQMIRSADTRSSTGESATWEAGRSF